MWKTDLGVHNTLSTSSSPIHNGDCLYTIFKDQGIFALNPPDGKIVWNQPLQSYSTCSPGFHRGLIIAGDWSNRLLAMDAVSGTICWDVELEDAGQIYGSPTFIGHSMIVGTGGRYLYSIDLDTGNVRWKKRVGKILNSCATNGKKLYFANEQGRFFCIDASTGDDLWHFQSPVLAFGCTPLLYNNVVYFGTEIANTNRNRSFKNRPAIRACNADTGELIWEHHLPNSFSEGFATDGRYLFLGGGSSLGVRAIDLESGDLAWKQDKLGWTPCSPIAAESYLYVGGGDGSLHCMDKKTGDVLWEFKTGGVIRATPVVYGTWVYVQSEDGYMYGLRRK